MDKDKIDYDDPNIRYNMLKKGMMVLNPFDGLNRPPEDKHVRKISFEYSTYDDPENGTTRLIFRSQTQFDTKFFDSEDVKGIIKFFQGYLEKVDG